MFCKRLPLFVSLVALGCAGSAISSPSFAQEAPPSLAATPPSFGSDPAAAVPALPSGLSPLPSAAEAQVDTTAPPTVPLGTPASGNASTPVAPSVPELGDVLGAQGLGDGALPPGFELPVDQSLPDAEEVEAETAKKKEAEIRQRAFDAALTGMFPLKPDEIRRVLEMGDEIQQAKETPLFPSPNPESVFTTISLDPGEKPLVIKTAMGHVTTMSIVDASGQPWPILDISWAGNFDIQQPESGSNMLCITPTSEFATGNVSMRLAGLNPPVILAFRSDRENVHVRIDVQIPELGPNGIAPLISNNNPSASSGDSRLASVLEGVAPKQAKKLEVSGIDGRTTAYQLGKLMYVRSPYSLLSPAWSSSVRSADGMNVYSLEYTPVLLLSDKGKMVRAYLSGEEQANGQ